MSLEVALPNGAKLRPRDFTGLIAQAIYGDIFYVNSATGSDTANNGLNPDNAFATLGAAVAAATASHNDIILLMPGHAENISSATALNISKAGLTILGIGKGARRPKITLDTANTATITVSANNIYIENVVFVANFLAIAALFTLTTATDFQLFNDEFRDTSSVLNFIALVVTNTTSNNADGFVMDSCNFFGLATSGAVKLASVLGTNDRWKIKNNYYATPTTNAGAVIPIATGKILTNLQLLNNNFNLVNAAGTGTGYIFTTDGSTNSGFIDGNKDHSAPTTPLFGTASSGFVYGLNYHADVADLAGYLVPAADV